MANHLSASGGKRKGSGGGGRRRAWVAPLAVVLVLLAAYLGGVALFSFYFMPGTVLDGQDVSLRSVSETAREKAGALSDYQAHVSGQGVDLTLSADQIDLSYDGEAYASEAVQKTNPWAWPVRLASGTHEVTAESAVVFDREALVELLSPFMDQAEDAASELGSGIVSFDAETGEFVLDESAAARYLDEDAVIDALSRAFAARQTEIELGKDQLVEAGDAAHAAVDAANAYLGAAGSTLTLDGEPAAEVTVDDIASWVVISDDLDVSLDADAVGSWVFERVSRLNTVGSERTYTRPDGKKVSVKGGTYGWRVSEGDAASALLDAVSEGTPSAVEIPFEEQGTAVPDEGGRDWGARYIDIDLTEQHVRFYDDDGNLAWESDCVTGDASEGRDTPTGVNVVNGNMARDQTLIGLDEDNDGEPDYKSHVDYWIPFVGNLIALHDADWRSSFGGDIYKWGGSHGCVNLPVDKAAELYDLVKVGDVVVVHY